MTPPARAVIAKIDHAGEIDQRADEVETPQRTRLAARLEEVKSTEPEVKTGHAVGAELI